MENIIEKSIPKNVKNWAQVAYVRFIVEKDGSIHHVHVINKVHTEVKKEAIRLLNRSPRWIPGTQKGRNIRAYFTQSISFVVEDEE